MHESNIWYVIFNDKPNDNTTNAEKNYCNKLE